MAMSRLQDEYPNGELFIRGDTNNQWLYWTLALVKDIFFAWVLAQVFSPQWEYPLIYCFLIVQALALLGVIVRWIFEKLFESKDMMLAESRHYISLYSNHGLDLGDVSTYDDLHYDAAFSSELPDKIRVLAGINYGSLVGANSVKSGLIDKYDDVFRPYLQEWYDSRRNDK